MVVAAASARSPTQSGVTIQLIFHALSCPNEVSHILGAHDTKLGCGREENVATVLDERSLLSLANVKLLENAARFTKIGYIAEHAFDE